LPTPCLSSGTCMELPQRMTDEHRGCWYYWLSHQVQQPSVVIFTAFSQVTVELKADDDQQFNWIQVNARHSCRLKLSTLNRVVIFSGRDAFDEMCNFWFFCYELTKILYINQLTKNLWSSNKKLIFLCRIALSLPSL
jgi:hypothetical protein